MKTPSMLLSTNILSLQDTLFRQTQEKETSKCYTTTTLSCFVIATYYSNSQPRVEKSNKSKFRLKIAIKLEG